MSALLTIPVGPEDHVQGPEDAPVTLVEYGDFECPHCGRAYPVIQAAKRAMGARLRFVYRHFPLTQQHLHAQHAAEMAEAAGQRDQFWQMHSLLFEHQNALEDVNLVSYARALGLDGRWATDVLTSHTFAPKVRRDFMSGVRSGVNGTPTLFINGARDDSGTWQQPALFLQMLEQYATAAATG